MDPVVILVVILFLALACCLCVIVAFSSYPCQRRRVGPAPQPTWTADEDARLAIATEKYPANTPGRWDNVSRLVGRSATDCDKQARLVRRRCRISRAPPPPPPDIVLPATPPLPRRLDVSSAAALLTSLRQLIPTHLKNGEDIATHMPLLAEKLLSGITLRVAFEECTKEQAVRIVKDMERLGSVLGIAAAFSARIAAAGPHNVHSRDHDSIVAQQSSPGGEAHSRSRRYLCDHVLLLSLAITAPLVPHLCVCRRQDGLP